MTEQPHKMFSYDAEGIWYEPTPASLRFRFVVVTEFFEGQDVSPFLEAMTEALNELPLEKAN